MNECNKGEGKAILMWPHKCVQSSERQNNICMDLWMVAVYWEQDTKLPAIDEDYACSSQWHGLWKEKCDDMQQRLEDV